MACKTLRGLCFRGGDGTNARKEGGNARGEGAKFRWAEPERDNLSPAFSRDPEKLEGLLADSLLMGSECV